MNAPVSISLYPHLALACGLLVVLLTGIILDQTRANSKPARALALASTLLSLGLLICPLHGEIGWKILFLCATVILLLIMRAADEASPALALATALGMLILASARHLFLIFLGFELMSLPTYLLLYRLNPDSRSLEAAVKYFFAGSLAAAMFLFGMSIFYANTGSFILGTPLAYGPGAELAIILMAGAALFKIGAFPFHFWLPDAYEAAPPELTGFMSTAIKAAGFLLLWRLVSALPLPVIMTWLPILSVATMTLGNLLALRQDNIQRLLAYSSIAHAGYLLAAVWAGLHLGGIQTAMNAAASTTLYFYLIVYLFMNSGAFLFLRFACICDVRQLRGISQRRPALAALWGLMLLSLAGVPPTAGFLAKFYVIVDILRAGGAWLAAALALNSLIGLGYYFRFIRESFLEPSEQPTENFPSMNWRSAIVAYACAAGSLLLGLWPGVSGWLQGWL